MSLLFKHLLAANASILNRYGQLFGSLALLLCALNSWMQPAIAEGSRTLYPSSAPAGSSRANLEWRTNTYGNIDKRRTLLKVYANQGEYILLGSSAVKQGRGDILVYAPGKVSGRVGSESIPSQPDFKCSQQVGRGFISSRAKELAGPSSINGKSNTSGYTPCYYQAKSTGVYDIIFYGPDGSDSSVDGTPTADINLTSSSNFDQTQGSSVAAWDVTVRSSDQNSTTDLNGRLFAYYLTLFTGGNGYPLYSSIYYVTNDGYQYKVDLRGIDPNGFVIYGNQVGFFNSDGKSILYHDVIGQDGDVANPDGKTSLSRPQYPAFFNSIDSSVLSYLTRYRPDGTLDGVGISPTPIPPKVDSLKFQGSVKDNTSTYSKGGKFSFNSSITGNYQIVISRDGKNFDPTNPQNAVLRGVMATSGSQSVSWNGKDNSSNYFPVGNNYLVSMNVHAGEYHFPILDAENNYYGGPTIKLLNASNPLGNTTGFYDDRQYKTINGTPISDNQDQTYDPNKPLCGINPPTIFFSDPIKGFDTATNQRAFGQQGNAGNSNVPCTGSFGDTKGLDMWTYLPSSASTSSLNIVASATKEPVITATKTVSPTGSVTPSTTLTYTIVITNTGAAVATGVTLADGIPAGTTYIPNSTKLNGKAVTDVGGAMPFATANGMNSPGAASGTLNIGTKNAATVIFQVKVNSPYTGPKSGINNQGTVNYNDGPTNGILTDDPNVSGSADPTVNAVSTLPKLLLVKRITAINNVPFNQYVHDPNSTEDNDSNWPVPASTYLRGAINGGAVKPGDELEYTVYFLSKGTNDATNVTICDPIPNSTTFIATAFNGLTPTDGGSTAADMGIALALDSVSVPTNPTVYLTNDADSDRGQFFSPGTVPPSSCSGSNANGSVVVDVVKMPNTIPYATTSGKPTNSYGFIRFRAKVK